MDRKEDHSYYNISTSLLKGKNSCALTQYSRKKKSNFWEYNEEQPVIWLYIMGRFERGGGVKRVIGIELTSFRNQDKTKDVSVFT